MPRPKIYKDDMNDAIVKLYNEGFSLNRIAVNLSSHPQVIKRKLIALGIPVRSRSQAMTLFHAKKHVAMVIPTVGQETKIEEDSSENTLQGEN